MSIIFDEHSCTLTIHTCSTTYQMQIDDIGCLLHLYYGTRTDGMLDYLPSRFDRGTSAAPYEKTDDRAYSLDFLPQEYPVQGAGDMRSPLLVVRDADGAFGCDLRYAHHEIRPGKYGLEGLPAVYADADADEAQTLSVTLADRRIGLEVELLYGVLPQLDVICRAAVIRNSGQGSIVIEKAQTACLDLVHGDFDLIALRGRHGMERVPERAHVGQRSSVIGSAKGSSSHQQNPFLLLADRDTTETAGRCWAMEFVYSGSFKGEAARDQYGQTRLQLGLSDELFSYPLDPGERLIAPEVIMTYSREGFGKLSDSLHRCVRSHVCRGYWRDRVRPVLINSWEAFYFDFDGKRIVEFAAMAKDMGIELLVVDDGWFANRYDDRRSLGDWRVNEAKIGGPLGQLISAVNDAGLQFGIWMEPEMVSEDSELYHDHPDWVLAIPGKAPVIGRHQLVLDLSRPDVRDDVFAQICGVLDQGPVAYLKWDYNRLITDVYSHSASDQGKVLYDYVLGLYSVLERVGERYPELLIEGCAGGGGRFDAGMLYYTPQIWCSDNTDAVDRLYIQYGTSFAYPCSTVGAHVAACPNEHSGRVTPFSTRAAVASAGTFGYELDLKALPFETREKVRAQVRWYKRIAPLVQQGRYHRLSSPLSDPVCAWEHVLEDGSQALVSAVVLEVHGYGIARFVVPRDLTPGACYRDTRTGAVFEANALMDMGIPLPIAMKAGEYRSHTFLLERI